MKPEVVFLEPFHLDLARKILGKKFTIRSGLKTHNASVIISLLTHKIDRALLNKAPKLQVLGNYAVGLDNIDLIECRKRGITVVNTPNVLTRSTAELTAMLLLACARRITEGQNLCRSGKFKGWTPDLLLGQELKGRRALIVGRGRIGRETGRIFRALGLRVQYVTRTTPSQTIRRALTQAQVVSLHLPYTRQTHHWLSRARLACLRPDCIVINTSRGAVVDERALIQALRSRRIFAAGLDVFEHEPKIPLSLRKLSNVVLVPHVGSATSEARRAMARTLFEGVRRIFKK